MNNLATEYSSPTVIEANTTSACDKVTMQYQILKSIAYEVFKREKQGDQTAFDILKTVFKESKRAPVHEGVKLDW